MALAMALRAVAAVAPPALEQFRRELDPAWIDAALAATGKATLRRRRLPAEQVLWLVLGMALYRDRSIVEVAAALDLALPGVRGPTAAPSAVSQARTRLGPEPLAWLFAHCAGRWASASAEAERWRGLALYGLDGTTLRVADSGANRAHFGGQSAGEARGPSGYPLLRLVALMALRSHVLAAAAFGPYAHGEGYYAAALWPDVPNDTLTIVDRNFLAAGMLLPLAASGTNRHWLVRAKATTRTTGVATLGPGDTLVELAVSREARRADPTLPRTFRARALTYQRTGHAPHILLTSLLDPVRYPAAEVVALYHERWELELGYDELKTEVLERAETLRSQSPAAVAQELWGVLLAYNLVRVEMARAAALAGVPPTRISFVAALHLIRDEWLWSSYAAPGAIPRHLDRLRHALTRLVLPVRRPERHYPRAVKRKMSNYPRKRPTPPPGPAK
jgi:Insertion element 4 transposase N-terminal/Transposase DDE domain